MIFFTSWAMCDYCKHCPLPILQENVRNMAREHQDHNPFEIMQLPNKRRAWPYFHSERDLCHHDLPVSSLFVTEELWDYTNLLQTVNGTDAQILGTTFCTMVSHYFQHNYYNFSPYVQIRVPVHMHLAQSARQQYSSYIIPQLWALSMELASHHPAGS
jgi:hypothetical protein